MQMDITPHVAASLESTSSNRAERYRITGQLGLGGMGVVLEALDTWRQRRVALKFPRRPPDGRSNGRKQLTREAHAQALPNDIRICSVYDVTTCDGLPCLVMERLVGGTLEARIEAGHIGNEELVNTAVQLAEALAAVHRVGLVHQDIKPANLFLTRTGLIKLLDFGLAVSAGTLPGEPGAKKRAAKGAVLGTANYIAPERILRRPADLRSDLFSLGAVIYEMATGRPPFAGATPAEIIFNVLDKNPPAIHEAAPGRPIALARLVRKLLAKQPGDRYQSATAVRRALLTLRAAQPASLAHRNVSHSVFTGGNHNGPNNDRRAQVQ
jgi:serine/threonine protein kinase